MFSLETSYENWKIPMQCVDTIPTVQSLEIGASFNKLIYITDKFETYFSL